MKCNEGSRARPDCKASLAMAPLCSRACFHIWVVLAAGALVAACAQASLQPGAFSAADLALVVAVPTWDVDKDGRVTCADWQAYSGALFEESDADHDGFLVAEEYRALARTDKLFETVPLGYFDTDNTGKVSRAQFVDAPNRAFALLDKNHDCAIDKSELVKLPARPGGRLKSGGKGKR